MSKVGQRSRPKVEQTYLKKNIRNAHLSEKTKVCQNDMSINGINIQRSERSWSKVKAKGKADSF